MPNKSEEWFRHAQEVGAVKWKPTEKERLSSAAGYTIVLLVVLFPLLAVLLAP